jgi:lysophospholipase L1-like esterase
MLLTSLLIIIALWSLAYLSRAAAQQKKSWGIDLAIALSSSCVLFLVFEFAFHMRQWIAHDVTPFTSISYFDDAELGWKGRFFDYRSSDARSKLLVLGDSFTEGMQLPRDDLYFSFLEQHNNINVAAYAGQGYGTLQELLALKQLKHRLKPDVVLLQLCSNDFINNSWELEHRSALQSAPWLRPYMEGGEIKLRFPRSFPETRIWLTSQSRMFHFIFRKLDLLNIELAKRGLISVLEQELLITESSSPAYREATELTKELLIRIKAEAAPAPVYAFVVDNEEPAQTAYRAILPETGILFDNTIGIKLRHAEQQGLDIRLSDGAHLNAAGHRLLGELLVEFLQGKSAAL